MTEQGLDKIREFLLSKLGLDYSKKRERELYAKLTKAAKDFNFRDTNKFIEWLLKQPMNDGQTKLLASSLTIGETYFFREKNALDYIQQVHLPELIRQRKGKKQKLRIWSAGCATGEEPYSIAILLQQTIPDYKNWDITILATDINPTFLSKARKGVYSHGSFRKTPESFQTNYFKKLDKNNYQINDSIKNMVTFSHLNLATESYSSPQNNTNSYDIILCRNVLIYFSLEGIKDVTKKFYKALNIDGMLAVSPVETSNLLSSSFATVSFNGNTFFRKDLAEKLNPKSIVKKKLSSKIADYKLPAQIFSKKVPVQKNTLSGQPKAKSKQLPNPQKSTKSKALAEDYTGYDNALKYYNFGKLDEAEQLLKCLIVKETSDKKEVLFLLAKVYASKNQLEESEKWCKKAIHLDKINIEAHYLLSTIYSEQDKINEAVQSLNNTLFLNPDFVLAHFLLGNIYMKQGKTQTSTKHFENAKKSLSKFDDDDIINESDGLTAGRFSTIIESIKPFNLNSKAI